MDGVIYRGSALIQGAQAFVDHLKEKQVSFIFLTNNSEQTPADLQAKLARLGVVGVGEDNFITSAMATALFLKSQGQGSTAYVIGGNGLTSALQQAGFMLNATQPDYVVVGKAKNISFDMIKRAANFIRKGAKFIGTNPDVIDPVEDGIEPACGTLLSAVATASGRQPYIVGKPNSLMMTIATRKLGAHVEETMMIGDRMDTDIIGGIEAGMHTCLVLSGVTAKEDLHAYPYQPSVVLPSIAHFKIEHVPDHSLWK